MRSGILLRNLLLVFASFVFVTLLIYFTGKVAIYWYLYAIPIFIAAFTYDVAGGSIVGVASCAATFWWTYRYVSTSFIPRATEAVFEINFGVVLLAVIGVVFGFLSKRQKSQQRRLEDLSRRDELTSLRNYSYFINRLTEEIKRSDRYGASCSLILIDVDNFRKFNNTFGYQKGDLLLMKVAKIIHREIRQVDLVARYSGEEFVVLLPNTEVGEAGEAAERIRKGVQTAQFEGDSLEPLVKKTVSLGVAGYPADAASGEELITSAGAALKEAKKTGCNKVCFYHQHCLKSASRTDREKKIKRQ